MSAIPQVQQHPASVDAYIRHGWSLVPIPSGTKGPRTPGWNKKESAIKSQTEVPTGFGIGLAHAYSGTMAFDIDNWDITVAQGIDLKSLYDAPDAVIIDSGRQGHGKLLYKMPFGLALPSKKIIIGGITIYELRCATANGLTVQDVLPPSIHPDTRQPYRWAGRGHWERLPTIPQMLLDLWQGFLEKEKDRNLSTGDALNASWEEIRSALEHIDPDCSREEWVQVGMALKWAGEQTGEVDQALSIWHDWSKPALKYLGEREIVTQWSSFKNDKFNAVKLGTLFHLAKQHGWSRAMPDISDLFKSIESAPIPPVDVMAGLKPPAPEIDLSLWPSVLATRAMQMSESVGCDPLVPLFAGLSAVCGVVDARIRLELMPGFQVPPVLWLMTIGDPADKKSPGSRPMLSVLKTIETEDLPRYKKDLLTWEGKEAAHEAAHKAYLAHMSSSEGMLDPSSAPMVQDLPEKPAPLKITVSDITSQKLVRHASERPRGLLCYLDEMNSWVKKLTDKTSGEDRSTWVVSYESETYDMDRVGSGSIHCENLAISIYGNIQPRVYKDNLASLTADGLLQRFIPAILRGDKTRLGEPIPEFMTNKAQWEQMLRLVYALPAQTYKLSPDAHKVFREFQRWYESAKRDERTLSSPEAFMTAFGKIEGTAGRLILVLHLMERPFDLLVQPDVVERVIRIVKEYVIPAFRYSLGEVGGVNSFDAWVADYVIQHADKATLTMSEIKRSARRQVEHVSPWQADQMVINAMTLLEQSTWVVRMDDGTKEHQHIAQWGINPQLMELFKGHRKAVLDAKQRQLDEIYKSAPYARKRVAGAE